MNAESLLAVTGLADLLAGAPRRVTVADAERANRIPRDIRRSVRRFLKGERAEKVDRPPFDYDKLADQLTATMPDHVVEDLISTLPADAEMQGAYAVSVNRALGFLRGALPVRSTMTTTGPVARRPPDLDVAKFRRTWEIAESPLVAMADLEAGRLVPDQVRAFAAMYPELYDAAKVEAFLAIADIKGEKTSWRLPMERDRRLQTFLQTNAVTPGLSADIQRVFQPTEPPPQKPAPTSSKLAQSFAAPSSRAGENL